MDLAKRFSEKVEQRLEEMTDITEDAVFQAVRTYADLMIEHGRDRYGSEHSPLFAGQLNVETRRTGSADLAAALLSYALVANGRSDLLSPIRNQSGRMSW